MSHDDYIVGRQIATKGYPFYALIQAAIRQADTDNLAKLEYTFPEIVRELRERYQSPEGRLPEDGERSLNLRLRKEKV